MITLSLHLSFFSNGSPCVAFALFLPSLGLRFRVFFFLPSWSTPTSVLEPVFAFRLVRLYFIVRRCAIIAVEFTFSFLLCVSLLSFSSGFSTSLCNVFCLSVICVPGCVLFPTALFVFSLFASFLLLRRLAAFPKLRLLRSCFSWGFLYRLHLQFFHL